MVSTLYTFLHIIIVSLFIIAGISHFLFIDLFLKVMPPYIPFHRECVLISGLIEIISGMALCIPSFRTLTAWILILLLLAVYPVNIHVALNPNIFTDSRIFIFIIYLRLPLQFVLIGAIWHLYIRKKLS